MNRDQKPRADSVQPLDPFDGDSAKQELFSAVQSAFFALQTYTKARWDRFVSFGDYFSDRWEKARRLGFGEGSSVYDNVLVLGEVKVGEFTWVGPNTVLDGSGGLEIGSYCSISAGVQIYSHDSVDWSLSGGTKPISRAPTRIGSRVYIGPNSVISKGVVIGDGCVIGAGSLVLANIPPGSKAVGSPCRVIGSAIGSGP